MISCETGAVENIDSPGESNKACLRVQSFERRKGVVTKLVLSSSRLKLEKFEEDKK